MAKVQIFSTTFYSSLFQVGSQHIYRNLKQHGSSVRFIAEPNSIINLLNLTTHNNRLRALESVLSLVKRRSEPIVPLNFLPYRFLRCFFPGYLAEVFSRPMTISSKALVVPGTINIIDSISYLYLIPSLLNASAKIIYRPTDIYYYDSPYIYELECKYVKLYKISVFCMSEASAQFYKSKGFNVVGWSLNGIPDNLSLNFVKLRDLPKDKPLELVYVGAIDDRLDIELLVKINSSPLFSLALYGDGPSIKKLYDLGLADVYHGPLSFSKLSEVLSITNIGLLPFNDSDKNLSRSPMKRLEYIAFGNDVLTRQMIVEVLALNTLNEVHSFILGNRLENKELSDELTEHSWSSITKKIFETLDINTNMLDELNE